MNRDEKKKINKNRKLIVDNVEAAKLIDYLRQEEILDMDDKETVLKEITSRGQMSKLLDKIEKRPNGFRVFLDALQQYPFYGHIVKKILDAHPANNPIQEQGDN